MSDPTTPAPTHRCSLCATENPAYTGDVSEDACVDVEVFNLHRGSQTFRICHGCSTAIVAAWARIRGGSIRSAEASSPPVTECNSCGEATTNGKQCEACETLYT